MTTPPTSTAGRRLAPHLARRIEVWPIERLKPYLANPREHGDAQVDQIAGSILRFGFNNPILVDGAEGVVAGHGRLKAAARLGLTEVPVVVLDHLSDAERRAYLIADNQIAANATWNDALLARELRDLEAAGAEVDGLGFDDDALDALLGREAEDDAGGGGSGPKVVEIDTCPVADRFWISVRGPLRDQAHALQRLRAVMADLPSLTVELSTVEEVAY